MHPCSDCLPSMCSRPGCSAILFMMATATYSAWIGNKLDATQRRSIMFTDRDDILKMYMVTNRPVSGDAARPVGEADPWLEEPPF